MLGGAIPVQIELRGWLLGASASLLARLCTVRLCRRALTRLRPGREIALPYCCCWRETDLGHVWATTGGLPVWPPALVRARRIPHLVVVPLRLRCPPLVVGVRCSRPDFPPLFRRVSFPTHARSTIAPTTALFPFLVVGGAAACWAKGDRGLAASSAPSAIALPSGRGMRIAGNAKPAVMPTKFRHVSNQHPFDKNTGLAVAALSFPPHRCPLQLFSASAASSFRLRSTTGAHDRRMRGGKSRCVPAQKEAGDNTRLIGRLIGDALCGKRTEVLAGHWLRLETSVVRFAERWQRR